MKSIADRMISLKEMHPQITYDILSGSVAEIADGLNKGLFDFGLLVAPVDMQKYDYVKLPQNDIFGLLMRKDCPLASLPAVCSPSPQNFFRMRFKRLYNHLSASSTINSADSVR